MKLCLPYLPSLFSRLHVPRRGGPVRVRPAGRSLLLGLLGAGVALGMSPAVRAQQSAKLTSLYSFTGVDDGYSPNSLLQASDGNFYGTTYGGGAHFYGSVFKVTPAGVLTTIYSFTGATDGGIPGGGGDTGPRRKSLRDDPARWRQP